MIDEVSIQHSHPEATGFQPESENRQQAKEVLAKIHANLTELLATNPNMSGAELLALFAQSSGLSEPTVEAETASTSTPLPETSAEADEIERKLAELRGKEDHFVELLKQAGVMPLSEPRPGQRVDPLVRYVQMGVGQFRFDYINYALLTATERILENTFTAEQKQALQTLHQELNQLRFDLAKALGANYMKTTDNDAVKTQAILQERHRMSQADVFNLRPTSL